MLLTLPVWARADDAAWRRMRESRRQIRAYLEAEARRITDRAAADVASPCVWEAVRVEEMRDMPGLVPWPPRTPLSAWVTGVPAKGADTIEKIAFDPQPAPDVSPPSFLRAATPSPRTATRRRTSGMAFRSPRTAIPFKWPRRSHCTTATRSRHAIDRSSGRAERCCGRRWARRHTARRVDVIAHRGEHRVCPENTLPAIEKTIALGCDWVGIDVRTTRDGQFLLMHNRTVDATTDGRGHVAELSFAEIRRLPGCQRDYGSRHCGRLAAPRHAGPRGVRFLRTTPRAGGDGHAHMAMPVAVSVETLRRSLTEIQPRVVAFDPHEFRDEVIEVARQAGTGIFLDRLGPEDRETHWEDAIRRGATGIQTDRPAELVQFLAGQ